MVDDQSTPPGSAPLAVLVFAVAGCTTFADAALRGDGGGGGQGTTTATMGTSDGGGGGGPRNPGGAYLPLLDAAQVCAVIGECPALGASLLASLGLPVVTVVEGAVDLRFSACLEWLSTPMAEGRIGFDLQQDILYCVAASSCEGALGCLPVAILGEVDPPCGPSDPPSRCEANDLVLCPGSVVVRCEPPRSGPGSGCVTIDAQSATCGIDASCSDPPRCDGSFAVVCDPAGVLSTVDCSLLGLSCSAAATEAGGCATQEGPLPCSTSDLGRSSCSADGERVYTCAGATVGQTDCDALGLLCVPAGQTARCGGATEACSPFSAGADTCDGSVLHGCVGGAPIEVDCARLGRTCADAEIGPAGSLSGRCRRLGG